MQFLMKFQDSFFHGSYFITVLGICTKQFGKVVTGECDSDNFLLYYICILLNYLNLNVAFSVSLSLMVLVKPTKTPGSAKKALNLNGLYM